MFPWQLSAALQGIAVGRYRETGTERVRGARVGDTSENRVRVSPSPGPADQAKPNCPSPGGCRAGLYSELQMAIPISENWEKYEK